MPRAQRRELKDSKIIPPNDNFFLQRDFAGCKEGGTRLAQRGRSATSTSRYLMCLDPESQLRMNRENCTDNLNPRLGMLLLMIEILQTLRTLDYGNYGLFLMMFNAGLISSTVSLNPKPLDP